MPARPACSATRRSASSRRRSQRRSRPASAPKARSAPTPCFTAPATMPSSSCITTRATSPLSCWRPTASPASPSARPSCSPRSPMAARWTSPAATRRAPRRWSRRRCGWSGRKRRSPPSPIGATIAAGRSIPVPTFAGHFTTSRRQPAQPLEPVADPAGWQPAAIAATEDWAYRLTPRDIGEITAAIERAERRGIEILDMTRADFPLPTWAALLLDVRQELREVRGFVYLRGLPVAELGLARTAIAYFGLGLHLGAPVPQNSAGHLLGHVRDFGVTYDDPGRRGYQSAAALGFHCDHADYVGLLCLRTAKSGGASRVASAVTLYNRMLAQRPDLVAELLQTFYWTRHGETPPGKPPWYTQPVFSFEAGYFSARGVSSYIRKAQ